MIYIISLAQQDKKKLNSFYRNYEEIKSSNVPWAKMRINQHSEQNITVTVNQEAKSSVQMKIYKLIKIYGYQQIKNANC